MSTTEETFALRLPPSARVGNGVTRLWRWLTHLPNFVQLVVFLVVGVVGYAVNLGVFAFGVHIAGIDYRASVIVAWLVAVATTFVLNRHITFRAGEGRMQHQAWRYFLVNLGGFATNFVVLLFLVEVAGLRKLPSEAFAAIAAAPVNYVGGRLWAFARR